MFKICCPIEIVKILSLTIHAGHLVAINIFWILKIAHSHYFLKLTSCQTVEDLEEKIAYLWFFCPVPRLH